MRYRTNEITNIEIKCEDITKEEEEKIVGAIREIAHERKRKKQNRLLYNIEIKENPTKITFSWEQGRGADERTK